MKCLIGYLILMSPMLLLSHFLGDLAVFIWVINSVILTALTQYVMRRKPKEYDDVY
ncbi:Uncharacterised protein [Serratia ficaria]|uniref:Uncharacterized protein n=1 Tax=Serratia ficaria TaxID=61651 RepID=A0A240BV54_SERFI|nr:hypothetical protein C7332_3551 [Serratia ficaria]CAI0871995.1 Uncharacterised protein [Serratia ficaria]CAI0908917.1 Uncharacterised protein [Serratia ficaria]CAI0923834.1 Uncharacterised protein [Serratia ficaria]CAI2007321.1 Uncharacterised protein [Serratia ficaria]